MSSHAFSLSRIRVALAALLMIGLAACSQNFRADVSRFQSQLPAPQGQTFAVVADDPDLAGGLEFVGWFSNFSLARPLERARNALMMITVLRRV